MCSNGLVYKSKEANKFDLFVAYVTLSSIFFISWGYIFLIFYSIYYIYYHQNFPVFFLLTISFSTIWWAKQRWIIISDSYVFKTWRRFFKFRVFKESELATNQTYLFGAYPHGLFPMSLPLLSGVAKKHVLSELLDVPLAAIASNLFYTPILGTLCVWLGCVPATFECIENELNLGKSIVIMPDGIIGTYYSKRTKEQIFVKHRKGFIKTALRTGASLVPVYTFGHTQMFDVLPAEANSFIVKLSRRIGFAIVSFYGPFWLLPFIPHRTEITMVIGSPIEVTKTETPTHDQIDQLHSLFITQITNLYNTHKEKHLDYVNKKIEIL